MGDRFEDDDIALGQGQRQDRTFAGGQFQRVQKRLVQQFVETLIGDIDARPPVDAAQVFRQRQLVRAVAGDAADAGVDGKGDLDQFIQRRRIIGGAERAVVFGPHHGFQRGIGVQHPAAAGTQHVPRQIENAQRRRVQEPGDGALRVQRATQRKGGHVHAQEIAVVAVAEQCFDGVRHVRIRRLPQQPEQRIGLGHGATHPRRGRRQSCRRYATPAAHHAPLCSTFQFAGDGQPCGTRAVTSISIRIASSISRASIIVAAGRAWPKAALVWGQSLGKSLRSGRI